MNNKPAEQTPRVDACIAAAEAKHPHTGKAGKAGMASYFEAVHQELAPLARELERELNACRAQIVKRQTVACPNATGLWWVKSPDSKDVCLNLVTEIHGDKSFHMFGLPRMDGGRFRHDEWKEWQFIRAIPPIFEVQS